jgi:hypothetical protein
MKRLRLLVLLFTVLTVAFTGLGLSSAAADSGRYAKVVSISEDADANRRGTEVEVSFRYKCDGYDHLKAKVTLDQGRRHFEGEVKDLDCDGRRHTEDVKLTNSGGKLRNGDADVTVRLKKRGDTVAKKDREVEVEGVRRNGH